METMDDMGPCIPCPSTTIPLGPSESHGRPSAPSPYNAMVPTPKRNLLPIELNQPCDAVPDSAPIGSVMSC